MSYGDHRETGWQDCSNAFDGDDFDIEHGGTAEEIVDRTIAEWDPNDWLEQQDDDALEGLDPQKAFEAWLSGYRACAIGFVESALAKRMERAEVFYLAETDTDGAPVEFVERFDELEDAEVALAKTKRGRGAIYEGDLHGPTYRITPGGPANRSVPQTMWRNPPFQHAGDKPKAEVLRQFGELLADPDPGSLTIAEDLLLEHGLKLTDIGEALAKEGPENHEGDTKGWADDFPSAGEFYLSKTRDTESPDFMSVSWMVWRVKFRTSPVRRGYRIEITIIYKSVWWSEMMSDGSTGDEPIVLGGVKQGRRGLHSFEHHFPDRYTGHIAEYPSIIPDPGGTLKTARGRACDLAWKLAKEMKRHADAGSDAVDLVSQMHDVQLADRRRPSPRQFAQGKSARPTYGTPKALLNPRDNASGNWEVRSDSGLEGVFAREEDAHDYADELKTGVGARSVKVVRRRPTLGPRSSSATDNPSSFTPKGERMYQHVKQSYASSPRAKEIAARTVSARASEGTPGLVKNAKRTFADARLDIIYLLEDRGWSVSKALKIPHATSPDGSLRLWFKPQAVWYTSLGEQGDREGLGSSGYYHGGGRRHDYGDARSLWFDIRTVSNEQFLAEIQRRFPSALAAFP